ncbi:MAG TPA: hypothetical protein VK163_12610, partial [Opitutaceae bacterium]|nr:hypothetical protein [Opitutaceae bacterium]
MAAPITGFLRRLLPLTLLAALPLAGQTDTTPPSVPVNVAGTAPTSTSSVLYWTQSTDALGVAGYDVFRDGILVASVTDNTFAEGHLSSATTYTYRVAARDTAGNSSAQSAPATVTTDATDSARLVRPAQFTYLGAFRLPRDTLNNYSYGGTALAFNPARNSLFVRGHEWYQLVGEVSIPTPLASDDVDALPVATVLQNQADITEGHIDEVADEGGTIDGCKIGGLLVHENRLIGTSYAYYDGGIRARRSHFASSLDLAQTGEFAGMFTVGAENPGFVAGFMAPIPAEWQSALGGPVLTGQAGLAIITRTSMGPAASVFDPTALGSPGATPARLLVGYPSDHPTLGAWANEHEPNPQYDMSTFIRGIVFPAGTDSVLFFGTAGTGVPRYGLGTTNPALDGQPVPDHPGVVYAYDPIDLGKGCHAYPYTAFVWAYRAQDLARVVAGTAQPWGIVPYAIWPFSFPCGFNGDDIVGGAAYDPATNRLFLSHFNAAGSSHDKPVIHVYRLEQPAPPTDTYATWRAAHFSGSGLIDDVVSGPLADPDSAGVTNLQRYAHDLPARGP